MLCECRGMWQAREHGRDGRIYSLGMKASAGNRPLAEREVARLNSGEIARPAKRTTKEKFEARVSPEPNTGCWLWAGAAFVQGYGELKVGAKKWKASRLSYELYKGAIGSRLHVLHRCDVPLCVNPDHLFLGTDADNTRDKVSKGRHLRGTDCRNAKLSDAAVREIRSSQEGDWALGRRFGVNPSVIYQVRARKRWRHVA